MVFKDHYVFYICKLIIFLYYDILFNFIMSEKAIGKGKILIRKSGRGYENVYLYISSKIAKDSAFPFSDKEEVNIEIRNGTLIVSKSNQLIDLINKYKIENATLPRLIESKARGNKDKPFLLFKDEIFSYRQVHKISNKIANGLISLSKRLNLRFGKIKSSKVALLMPNCPDFIFCWFGIIKAGLVFVPINRFLKGEELYYIIENSDSEVLIIDYSCLNEFMKIKSQLNKLKAVIIRGAPKDFKFDDFFLNFNVIISNNDKTPKINTRFLDVIEIIYTEGTTGKPKGIQYRNLHILSGLMFSELIKRYGEGEVIYCPTPLFQTFAQLVIIFPALFYNATIALAEKFNAETFWDDVRKYKADLIVYYGGIAQMLIDEPPSEQDRNHTAKYALGGEMPKELWKVFEDRFGVSVYEGWAPSEAIGFTINLAGTNGGKIGSIGTPLYGLELKIVDNDGNELPPGPENVGEIIVKSIIPLDYYKVESPTKMYVKNGYFYTGDLGYWDKDGYFYYMGRKIDLIRRYGRIIYPIMIENVANAHPSVLESAAFGVPSNDPSLKESSEDIKICIVLKKNRKLTHQEFHYYLSENLAFFMVPRYIEIKKKLRQSSERIKKYKLKEEWNDKKIRSKTWDAKIKSFLS